MLSQPEESKIAANGLRPEKLSVESPVGRSGRPGRLGVVRSRLEAAAAGTEEKFLLLGGRLADFRNLSRDVAEQASEIAELLPKEASAEILGGLQALMASLERHQAELERVEDAELQVLEGIDCLLERLHQPLDGYRKVVRKLLNLGIATRIESCGIGLGGNRFHVLADELKNLAGLIGHRSAAVIERLQELGASCRDARRKLVQVVQSGQNEKARELLRHGASVLELLANRTRDIARQADHLSDRAAGFAGHIGEVVASIQFQDIVRQKLMHVHQALADLETDNPAESTAAGFCALQAAQLQHARAELEGAVRRIKASLVSLAEEIAGVAQRSREIAGVSGPTGASVLREVEGVISAITLLLREGMRIRREAAAAIGTVAGAIDDMAGLLEEIVSLGEKMQVVALNAGILAVQAGLEGAALGVIAEAVQQLSAEALDLTGILAGGFREVTLLADRLGEGEKFSEEVPGKLLMDATALLKRLEEINRILAGRLREMDRLAAALAGDLCRIADETDVHEWFSRQIEEILVQMGGAKSDPMAGNPVRAGRLFQEQLARYTMRSEREVHQGKREDTKGGRVIDLRELRERRRGSELGDNVELF